MDRLLEQRRKYDLCKQDPAYESYEYLFSLVDGAISESPQQGYSDKKIIEVQLKAYDKFFEVVGSQQN